MPKRTYLVGAVAVLAVAVAATLALAWRPAIDPIDPPRAGSFEPQQIAAGARLAAIGNCMTCHTADPDRPYAGGRPLATPFGTIYGTNITPDPATGLGRWSEAAFSRALHQGVDRDGRYLYPAFPYDHFTKLTESDTRALYAFIMTREPVRATTPAPQFPFPLNLRILLAGWDLLFLDRTPVEPEAGRDATWDRGAYLVAALAHCGACHTPRNVFGAEERGNAFAGGVSDDWTAPPLDGKGAGATQWTADSLAAYLHRGWATTHGAAAGPMQEVVTNLALAPESDVRAIAAYVASLTGPPPAPGGAAPPRHEASGAEGAVLFAATCAQCHDGTRPPPLGGIALTASTAARAAKPDDFVHIVLEGVHPDEGHAGPLMPSLAASLDDGQIAALAAYVRQTIGVAPWDGVAALAQHLRRKDNT